MMRCLFYPPRSPPFLSLLPSGSTAVLDLLGMPLDVIDFSLILLPLAHTLTFL